MEDPEVPTEHLHEHIQEAAEERKDRWSMFVAISTAFMAAFAALSSLMAGHHSNEALITQIKASDQWAYYQAKGIKQEIAGIVVVPGQNSKQLQEKIQKYSDDQKKAKEKAQELEKESAMHLEKDIALARAVTFFQVAISISAISILSKRRPLWYISLALFTVGVAQFIWGLL